MKKTYTGLMSQGILRIAVCDHADGNYTYEVKHIKAHSPSGMNIGYCGSGPADTALSILTDCLDKKMAELFYQFFKEDFVAKWKIRNGVCFQVRSADITKWIDENFTYNLDAGTIERKGIHGR